MWELGTGFSHSLHNPECPGYEDVERYNVYDTRSSRRNRDSNNYNTMEQVISTFVSYEVRSKDESSFEGLPPFQKRWLLAFTAVSLRLYLFQSINLFILGPTYMSNPFGNRLHYRSITNCFKL